MDQLAKDLSSASIDVSTKFQFDDKTLGIVDKETPAQGRSKPKSFFKRLASGTVAKISRGAEALADLVMAFARVSRAAAQKLPAAAKSFSSAVASDVLVFYKWFRSRRHQQKIHLFLLILASLGIVVITGRALRGEKLLNFNEDPFLRSWEQVATRVEDLKPDEPFEEFNSPLRNPEYVVLYKKMFVNLKAKGESRNPMAAFEIFIEASSQESAIELKDREDQFKDVIARVFEAMPYDQVATPEGKEKLKLIIRRNLNEVINKGRVRKVYFKTFFYKP
jgi:flagellar basal body-associated protein FliL